MTLEEQLIAAELSPDVPSAPAPEVEPTERRIGDPERRLALLLEVYRISSGDTKIGLGTPNVAECTRRALLSAVEGEDALEWLVDEALVIQRATNGAIYISHTGVKEIEAAHAHPADGTRHFPAGVVRNAALQAKPGL